MSEETAGCVLSVFADQHGIHAAAVGLDGELVELQSQEFTARRFGPFLAVDVRQVLNGLKAVVQALAPLTQRVRAIGLTTPRHTSLLLGEENEHLTPVLFGRGNKLAAARVPAEFQRSGPATTIYRQAVKHQLEAIDVDAVLGARRLASLGALLHHSLSGHWVDSAACPPTGVPWNQARQDYTEDALQWLAVGFEKRFCPLLVPPGGIAAQVAAQRAAQFGLPSGTPLVATADALACLSYGLKSNGSAWAVTVGEGLRATWTGPPPDTSMTIQILEPEQTDSSEVGTSDPSNASNGDVIDIPSDGAPPPHRSIDLDTLSHAMFARLEDRLHRRPGPRDGSSTFELSIAAASLLPTPSDALEQPGATAISESALMTLSAGADGLRYLPGRNNATLVGLRPGHTPLHVALAVLEGLCFELARWREHAGLTTRDPIRLVVEPPWGVNVAHTITNLICEPVLVWEGSRVNPILLGQALAVLRNLGMSEDVSPAISLTEVEPRVTAATEYETHRNLHATLMRELSMVID